MLAFLVATTLLSAPPEPSQAEVALQLWQRGKAADAIRIMEALANDNPGEGTVRYTLGVMYLETGNVERAVRELARSAELMPKHYDSQFNLGKLLAATGRPADGVEYLKAAVALKPDDPAAKHELAVALMTDGRTKAAMKVLEGIKPRDTAVLSLMAFTALKMGNGDLAMRYSKEALAAQPGNQRAKLMLATATLHAGERTAAVKLLKQLVRDAPATQANVPYMLALAAFLDGNPEEARRWMIEADARAPGRFDPQGKAFDPLAFPTKSDLAFLRWYGANRGRPKALEAHLPGMIMAGPCDPGTTMEHLMSVSRALQMCLPPGTKTHDVQAKLSGNGELAEVLVTPRGKPAGCIQAALRQMTPLRRRHKRRCSVRFEVRAAR